MLVVVYQPVDICGSQSIQFAVNQLVGQSIAVNLQSFASSQPTV
jgi:hypothetical protein